MKTAIYFVAIVLLFAACKKDEVQKDSSGVVVSQPHIWTNAVTDDNSRSINFFVERKYEYNGGIIISARRDGKNLLRMVNINDGNTKWEWSDFVNYYESFRLGYSFMSGESLAFFDNNRIYQINLSTGKTIIKREQYESYSLYQNGIQDKIFTSYQINKDGALREGGYVAVVDKNTLNTVDKFQPKYDTTGTIPFDDGGYYFGSYGVPFEKNGEVLVAVKYNDPANQRGMVGNQWLGLYNYTKKQWIYERQSIQKQSTWGAGLIYLSNDKVFTYSVGWVACHDLMTGQQLWKTVGSNGGGYLFAGLLIANGKVYANNDSGQLACFDINSGRKLWDIRSSGSSTELSYLNGVVYFVGGGDGKLHAVDAETGDYLWKIISPDLSKNKSAVFSGLCAVIAGKGSEKGKIVVLNGLNAYCYEAIR